MKLDLSGKVIIIFHIWKGLAVITFDFVDDHYSLHKQFELPNLFRRRKRPMKKEKQKNIKIKKKKKSEKEKDAKFPNKSSLPGFNLQETSNYRKFSRSLSISKVTQISSAINLPSISVVLSSLGSHHFPDLSFPHPFIHFFSQFLGRYKDCSILFFYF